MKQTLKITAIAGLVLLPSFVSAESMQLILDPGESRILWTLGATLHTVHGSFKVRSGTVLFDPKSGEASGAIIVDATSGESGNADRDKDMHNKVLQSAQYPEITFFPRRVTGGVPEQGNSKVEVQGVLRIHGSEHDLTVPMAIARTGDRIKGTADIVVPYQQWGMKNPSKMFLRVENSVKVEISIAGSIKVASAGN